MIVLVSFTEEYSTFVARHQGNRAVFRSWMMHTKGCLCRKLPDVIQESAPGRTREKWSQQHIYVTFDMLCYIYNARFSCWLVQQYFPPPPQILQNGKSR